MVIPAASRTTVQTRRSEIQSLISPEKNSPIQTTPRKIQLNKVISGVAVNTCMALVMAASGSQRPPFRHASMTQPMTHGSHASDAR
jgi:hypothetical protein